MMVWLFTQLRLGRVAEQHLPVLVFSYLIDESPYIGIIIFTPWQKKKDELALLYKIRYLREERVCQATVYMYSSEKVC